MSGSLLMSKGSIHYQMVACLGSSMYHNLYMELAKGCAFINIYCSIDQIVIVVESSSINIISISQICRWKTQKFAIY